VLTIKGALFVYLKDTTIEYTYEADYEQLQYIIDNFPSLAEIAPYSPYAYFSLLDFDSGRAPLYMLNVYSADIDTLTVNYSTLATRSAYYREHAGGIAFEYFTGYLRMNDATFSNIAPNEYYYSYAPSIISFDNSLVTYMDIDTISFTDITLYTNYDENDDEIDFTSSPSLISPDESGTSDSDRVEFVYDADLDEWVQEYTYYNKI
jgi:hypothetical protein